MDRFWNKVAAAGADDCWEWMDGGTDRGYGKFWHEGKNRRANRMALIFSGQPIPFEGAEALHSCDNPPCCNPKHLRWGTSADNVDDRTLRMRGAYGARNAIAEITDDIASAIMAMRIEGIGIKGISTRLSLPYTLVENVYTGNAWKHLHGINGNPTLAELRAARSKVKHEAPNRVITDEIADGIFAARMAGEKSRDIAKRLGLPIGTVSPVFCGLAFADRLGKHGNPTFDELRSVRAVSALVKLTDDDIDEIKSLIDQGYMGADIAKRYRVSKATISNIKRGKR